MKKSITLGNILLSIFFGYFIGAFFLYINLYSFIDFWNMRNGSGVSFYSAITGFLLLFITVAYGITIYFITYGLPKFIKKFWNYPVIKL